MPADPRASWRGVRDRFFLSSAEHDELRRETEARGREAWNNATRAGRDVVTRTQKELQALGARVIDAEQRPARAGGAPARPAKVARLSKNQQAAQSQFDNYRVDWWDKSHVGKAAGGLSGLLTGEVSEGRDH